MGVLSTETDVLFLLTAFEEALRACGYVPPAASGAGAAAARQVYANLAPVSVS